MIALIDEKMNDTIVDLYLNEQLSSKKIGEKLGFSEDVVARRLAKLKVPKRPRSQFAYKLDENYFDEIDTPNKAYWLGFLATDGNVYDSRVQINLKDQEHLEKFARCLKSNAPVKNYLSNGYSMYKIAFRNKKMVESLSKAGISPNKTWTVTPWVGPADLMRHYWRGVIDGDGWIVTAPGLPIELGVCGNMSIVEGFDRWCQELGFPSQKISKIKNIYRVKRNRSSGAFWIGAEMYRESEVYLDRKYIKFKELLETRDEDRSPVWLHRSA